MASQIDLRDIVDDWFRRWHEEAKGPTGRTYQRINDEVRIEALNALAMTLRNAGFDRHFCKLQSTFGVIMGKLANPTAKSKEKTAREQAVYKIFMNSISEAFAEEMTHLHDAAPKTPLERGEVVIPAYDPDAKVMSAGDEYVLSDITELTIEDDEPAKPEKPDFIPLDKSIFKDVPPVIREYDADFLAEIEAAKASGDSDE